jgi:DNA-binding MarR family transcriptional regulator
MPETRLARNLHMLRTLVGSNLEEKLLRSAGHDGLTITQLNALRLISANPKMHENRTFLMVGDIAERLQVSYPATSKILARLERMGCIEVEKLEDDRRGRAVKISTKGKQALKSFQTEERRSLKRLLAERDPEVVERWNTLLEELLALLHLMGSPKANSCLRCGSYHPSSCVLEKTGHRCPAQDSVREGRTPLTGS